MSLVQGIQQLSNACMEQLGDDDSLKEVWLSGKAYDQLSLEILQDAYHRFDVE